MLKDLETASIGPASVFTVAVGNFATRVVAAMQAHEYETRVRVVAGAIMTAYELGKKDGKCECVKQGEKIFMGGQP